MVSVAVSGGARAVARCDALGVAPYSDMPNGLYRAYLTPSHAHAQRTVAGWMTEAGMSTRLDQAGNLVGRFAGAIFDAPALLIGSHLDSVRDAGRYDGPLGVMLGIECVAALHAAGRVLPFPVEVIAFGDEEGSRFPTAMLTSRAVAGTLDPTMLDVADNVGVPLAQALADAGLDVKTFADASRRDNPPLAYLEAHIEQGPVLEAEGLPVGIVTGIAAQHRYGCAVIGIAGHAGTAIMTLRRDALAATAEMMAAAEAVARAGQVDLVATVGRLEVTPGAPNVVPGRVAFALDVRAGTDAVRDDAARTILDRFRRIAADRAVTLEVEALQQLPASPCNDALTALLEESIGEVGISPRRLVSGAGHDAMILAALCPTAMLFVRCKGGISHSPAESVDAADVDVALAVMLGFIEKLGERFRA